MENDRNKSSLKEKKVVNSNTKYYKQDNNVSDLDQSKTTKQNSIVIEKPMNFLDPNNSDFLPNSSQRKHEINPESPPQKSCEKKSDQTRISNSKIYWSYGILFLCSMASNMTLSSFPAIVDKLKLELSISSESSIGFLTTGQYIGQMIGKRK